uniref:Uncharacterized protein n=1 Tax=Octopus bimaculoides TaxID=37653 RepID=A0A0L8GFM4_OCTBM
MMHNIIPLFLQTTCRSIMQITDINLRCFSEFSTCTHIKYSYLITLALMAMLGFCFNLISQ